MKIQGLAIIAIIIILPMSIILNSYAQSQVKTLDLQVQYDSKLNNATYDAIKAFQLNMSNSSTSELANSKMRDIKASVNTFYNSLSSNFNMSGYGKDVLKNYVPAIVYTLYDGYYIYSTYDNKLDLKNDKFDDKATYQDGEKIDGLKPYVYYSCRYKPKENSDFVITYSLDSYITIQGTVNGNPINESGYLLTGVEKEPGGGYSYRGIDIMEEEKTLEQYVYVEGDTTGSGTKKISINPGGKVLGSIAQYPCKKINGVKYYVQNDGKVFSIVNDTIYNQKEVQGITTNNNGIRYYKKANELKNDVIGNNVKYGDILKNLKVSDAVDAYGKKYSDYVQNNPYEGSDYEIFAELFDTSGIYIEDENSNFNAHKLKVIKNAIESNLIPAISNYNSISTSEVNFAMPKLQEYEWEQITQNISMITFLQGLNIGGKIYNGYSIVSNNNNEDYVSEDSIYILNNGEYHRVTEEGLENNNLDGAIGVFNIDFERRNATVTEKINDTEEYSKTIYYYPREDKASYRSIVDINKNNNKSIYEYFKDVNEGTPKYKLAQIYYTALGRERFSMYRVMNKLEEIQEILKDKAW